MNKRLILLLIGVALFLQGCGSKVQQGSLTTFLRLHTDYCASGFKSAEQLSRILRKDETFQANVNNGGIYEKVVSNISYAVSPEADGCTTDLKIKKTSKSVAYFSFDEINTALIKRGYTPEGKKVYRDEIGTDQHELQVVEQKYISPDEVVSTLVFPLESQDKYYMTLFAETLEHASTDDDAPSVLEI
ncbi:MAG: hypothetical protein KAH22_01545 [Thiotrichaceae bacterium]|nr:hypothetical protein [Thiotrichaceae bacterium]